MTTVQETCLDSPTIPERRPLQNPFLKTCGLQRSTSAPPSSWQSSPFRDAMATRITGPANSQPRSDPDGKTPRTTYSKPNTARAASTKTSPSSAVGPLSCSRPVFAGCSGTPLLVNIDDTPPEVPPKSPSMASRASPVKRPVPRSISSGTPACSSVLPSVLAPAGFFMGSESPSQQRHGAPRCIKAATVTDCSTVDRGRQSKRSNCPGHSRAQSSAESCDTGKADAWALPIGLRPAEFVTAIPETERVTLRKQALGQAEKFQVLTAKDVAFLSKEVRALDERCKYLRKTYNTLRASRQKLHAHMVAYLRRDGSMDICRDKLLKQQEALVELELSIDEWIVKLEQADNRRLRARQKLLEHVAATVASVSKASNCSAMAEATPPRSPIDEPLAEASSEPRTNRRDIESIRVYADFHVLDLFAEIELAMHQMSETC
ncbi:hypothetical protein W97_07009 [Coniosporium apollinis CBS 100218]|uniref:Up-regulated during septation protein 1 domain-containing protein n=1 Tax=Coniosporium apollinis (strain CBS 100218) TaxID=1168221 RepID=R7Z0M0_CONA1|nr:uncharacterized protein W97_07009 [Coniosporium apollinis CBS 100218]EON67755.1 hypothetical protein W97_07009 [Coniosporium apollinis CBS 100218]